MNAHQQQMTLDDARLSRQVGTDERSLEAAFWTFHRAHPDVYDALVRLLRDWREAGGGRWSINGAFEVLRWKRHIDSLPDATEAYVLNNSYRSRYARLVLNLEPGLGGIFETRELRSA